MQNSVTEGEILEALLARRQLGESAQHMAHILWLRGYPDTSGRSKRATYREITTEIGRGYEWVRTAESRGWRILREPIRSNSDLEPLRAAVVEAAKAYRATYRAYDGMPRDKLLTLLGEQQEAARRLSAAVDALLAAEVEAQR